jgi:hypothetical protein
MAADPEGGEETRAAEAAAPEPAAPSRASTPPPPPEGGAIRRRPQPPPAINARLGSPPGGRQRQRGATRSRSFRSGSFRSGSFRSDPADLPVSPLDEPKVDLDLPEREKRGSTTTESGEEYDDAIESSSASTLLPGTPLRRTRSGSPRRDRSPSKAAAMTDGQLRAVAMLTGDGAEDGHGGDSRTLSPGRGSSSRFTSPDRGSSRRSPERSHVRRKLNLRALLSALFALPCHRC